LPILDVFSIILKSVSTFKAYYQTKYKDLLNPNASRCRFFWPPGSCFFLTIYCVVINYRRLKNLSQKKRHMIISYRSLFHGMKHASCARYFEIFKCRIRFLL